MIAVGKEEGRIFVFQHTVLIEGHSSVGLPEVSPLVVLLNCVFILKIIITFIID